MAYNLFISHAWSHSDTYQGLIDLLAKDPSFSYRNFSVPKDDPLHTNGTDKQLRAAITEQIRHAHVVLILTGVFVTYSRWIKIEVDVAKTAFSRPKPILGIDKWGAQRTSSVAQEAVDRTVGWNSAPIVRAIKEMTT